MFSDPLLATVNIILSLGIVLALLAAIQVSKGNRELHAENLARKKKELFPG